MGKRKSERLGIRMKPHGVRACDVDHDERANAPHDDDDDDADEE